MTRWGGTAFAGVMVACAAGAFPSVLPLATADPAYEEYTTWENWARLQSGVQTGLASSYDRLDGNYDFSHYESPLGLMTTNGVATIKTLQGPGLIYRFWMPHRTSDLSFPVRMYFDGESTPRIDTTSDVVFAGAFSYFTAPLVDTSAGGQLCYEPIPFAESLRIETVNKELPADGSFSFNRHYYQYTYKTVPMHHSIASYTGTLTPEQDSARQAMVDLFSNAGDHPAGDNPTAVNVGTSGVSVPPSDCLTVADLAGPGMIRRLDVRMDSATDDELDGLRLHVLYDDDASPAIDVAVGDFFGAGHERASYESLVLGTVGSNGFYCYWPMPFRESVLVQLCNTTGAAIAVDTVGAEYESGVVTADMCYLHARTTMHQRAAGEIYHEMLSANGRGHYVGNLLYIEENSYSFRMLEGDDVITVDGTNTLYGTGLEDAYNGGYYYNWVGIHNNEPEGPKPPSAARPLNGILYVHREEGVSHARADQYRWLIADRIPFTTSIDVQIETRYAATGSVWKSVAFWYQQPALRGDADDDGDLDLQDFAQLGRCFNESDPTCLGHFDFDDDLDVDVEDYRKFAESFSGPL